MDRTDKWRNGDRFIIHYPNFAQIVDSQMLSCENVIFDWIENQSGRFCQIESSNINDRFCYMCDKSMELFNSFDNIILTVIDKLWKMLNL